MPPLARNFYDRPTLDVARDLLGCRLCNRNDGTTRSGRIVEVEAYVTDEASHARKARRTPRNAVMFGSPGHAYVYLIYGIHFCFNVVTEAEGSPAAVLIRGLDDIERAAGPALLCKALGIDLRHNTADLTAGNDLWIENSPVPPAEPVVETTRIGIRQGADLPWRFYLAGSPGVSKRDRAAERAL